MEEQELQELKTNPIEFARQKGYNIPSNLANDPQAMVMHLVNSGQVGGQTLQKLMPMIRFMTGK